MKAGETLVVSGAAGAVGSVVCQLGKIRGARVIALAGSDDKVAWLENELGVDKALNYKSPSFVNDFKENVGYLDVYFDNGASVVGFILFIRLVSFGIISWWIHSRFVFRTPQKGCSCSAVRCHICI